MIDSVSDPLTGGPADAGADFKKPRRQKGDRRSSAAIPTLDRLPPHSTEAEMGVLGCCLLDPNASIGLCIEKLRDNGKAAFYDLRHATIYECLEKMFNARDEIDLITVQQWLKDRQLLEQIGGIAYLSQLQDAVPSAANLSYYLDIVTEKFTLRRLVSTCLGVAGKVYDYEGDLEPLLDEVEKEILSIAESRGGDGMAPINSLVHDSLGVIETFFQRQGQIGGISTGFPDFDKMTDGLHGGEMVVIAARPSMGKTSLAMNIAEHIAVEQKLPVGVFSLEMSATALCTRVLCSMARVNLQSVRNGFMHDTDFAKLSTASGRLSTAPLHIDDSSGLSILQLRARARRMWQQHGIKVFVIDYLQLLHSTSRKASENRQQEIAEISSGLKALAKELKVPVIVLAQLNREIEKDKSRKPRMADLRESGSIEQDADLIGLLYKPDRNEEPSTQDEQDAGEAVNLLIAKQRNGPTGEVNLTFLKPFTRFESAARFPTVE